MKPPSHKSGSLLFFLIFLSLLLYSLADSEHRIIDGIVAEINDGDTIQVVTGTRRGRGGGLFS